MPPSPAPDTAHAPLISVIVRSMDRASLTLALASVAAQSWPAVEVVVVNARGPTHGPLPQRCGDFQVVAANAGGSPLPRAQAANCGLAAARGELLLFLDDDDLLLPEHLARLATTLQATPQAPAAFADVEMGREDAGAWQALHAFDAGFDATRLWFENYLPIHAVLFRHPGPALRFDESFDLFEDWDFWLQLAARGAFVHVPGVSARYRVTEVEQSNVFADSPQANRARSALYGKWQSQMNAAQHAALLARLQTVWREAADQRAQLALAATTESNLKAIVCAREAEIAEAARLLTDVQGIVSERERELADSHVLSTGLQQIVDARTRDSDAAALHAAALANTIAARERELTEAHAHAAGLSAIVAARDRDNAQAVAHAAALSDIVTARDAEIVACTAEIVSRTAEAAARTAEVTALREQLTHTQQALQLLTDERPLQALQRTLKKRHEPGLG